MGKAREDAVNPKVFEDKVNRWLMQSDNKNLNAMIDMLGTSQEATRFKRMALQIVAGNPALLRCDFASFTEAFMKCIMTRLYPGLEASFVVFGNKVQFIPQYGGLIKLALQSGFIKSVWAEVVCEMDEFEVTEGLKRTLVHNKARMPREKRGERVAVYACYEGIHGNVEFHIMWPEEVLSIKKRSSAGGSKFSPWNGDAQGNFTDTDWMWKKTAVKQLLKMVPKSIELNKAITFDDEAEVPSIKKEPVVKFDDMEEFVQVEENVTIEGEAHEAN
jgi:recombination protein RecT